MTTTTISRREPRRSAMVSSQSSFSLSLSISLAAPHTRHTQAVLTARRAATQRRATASRAGVHGPSPRASRSRGSFVLSSSSGYRSRERTHAALLVDHHERARQCSRRPLLGLGRALLFEVHFRSMGRREFVRFSCTVSIHERSCVTDPCLIDDNYII